MEQQKISHQVNDYLSWEITPAGSGGTSQGVIRVNATPVVIAITDGTRTVQIGSKEPGKKVIVPGDIYTFAQRLEIWARRLIESPLPEVSSPGVYEPMGLLKELQTYSDLYVDAARMGIQALGQSLTTYKNDLWVDFSGKYLSRYDYPKKTDWKNLKKSFYDALEASLLKYRRQELLRS